MTPTIAEVREVLELHATYDDCYSGACPAVPLLARLDPDSMVIVTRDSLAAALDVADDRTYCHHNADAILAAVKGETT